MSDASSASYLPDSPYPGIPPFSYAHRNVFFSREAETRALVRLVVMYRGVLLYSESGTGKSSLVNAGLVPAAIAEGLQPETIRLQPRRGEEIVVERLPMEAAGRPPYLSSIFAAEQQPRVVLSLDGFLDIVRRRASDAHPLLIFDQFEEWITLFEDSGATRSSGDARELQAAVLEAIVTLLNDRELPVKVLIVLREDYLAKLAPLFESCPWLPDHYLRLTHLNSEQVCRTIRGPFDEYPGKYAPELGTPLAETITAQFEERSKGTGIRLTEVQIVCKSLYESGKEGLTSERKFDDLKGVQGILESYLEGALATLPEAQQDPAVGLLTHMLTPAGTRKRIARDDLLHLMQSEEYSPEVVSEALASLERTVLVRRESVRDAYYYEIASEFLVEWIQKKDDDRKSLAAEREAAKRESQAVEQRKREYEQRTRRQLQVGVAVLAVCLIAVGALLTVALKNRSDFDRELRYARAESLSRAAQDLSEQNPKLSLLLAVASASTLPGREPPVPAAEEALWRTLSGVSGLRAPHLLGHVGSVIAVDFSSDSGRLATASADGTAWLWDVEDPRAALDVLRGHEGAVYAVAFSPDGQWLATASADGTARLWGVQSLDRPKVLRGHEGVVYDVAFSPDGGSLATASDDGTARLWDVTTGQALDVLRGHESYVKIVVFSPDGHWLATASVDGTARLWDVATGQALDVLPGHEGEVSAIAFSVDCRWLATGSEDGTARLWDMAHSDAEPAVLRGHQGTVTAVAFSPDGHWLASAGQDGIVRLWDVADPTAQPAVLGSQGSQVNALAFSPGGRWLATASYGTVRLWDVQDPSAEPAVLLGHEGAVYTVAFSPNGRWLATGSGDRTARLWDVLAKRFALAPAILADSGQPIRALAVSPDGRWLAAASDDETLHVWGLTVPDPAAALSVLRGHQGWINTVSFSRDGRWLATGGDDNTARLWDMNEPAAAVAVLRGHEASINALAFSPEGRWLATASDDRTARVWDLTAGDPSSAPVVLAGHTGALTAVAFAPDGRWLATSSDDTTARLWDLAAADPAATSTILKCYIEPVTTIAFSSKGRWLVAGCTDGTACLWDMKAVNPASDNIPISLKGHSQPITAIAFSPNERWVVTASADSTARQWGDLSGNREAIPSIVLKGHRGPVTAVAFDPDGRWLVTGSADKTARKWDLTDEHRVAVSAELSAHEDGITAVAISQDSEGNRWLITGSRDGTVRLWTQRLDELIDVACSTAGRDLTEEEQKQYTHWKEYQADWPCGLLAPVTGSGQH